MNLVNHTPFAAEVTTSHDQQGRECLLLAVKATYRLPKASGGSVELDDRQQTLHYADTATAEPGLSAPVYECDLCLSKPMVDVLLVGSAYAPAGRPTDRVLVGLSVGEMKKSFVVTGSRYWRAGFAGTGLSEPQPFLRQSISYDLAFGGTIAGENPQDEAVGFEANPVGRGFNPSGRWPDETPGPQTEAIDAPIQRAKGSYAPMSFGPVGRHWQPRASYAGTYDAAWKKDRFPFLPDDFDARYFQAAPADQQLGRLQGREPVRLMNLTPPSHTPEGMLDFNLPELGLRVVLHGKEGSEPVTPKVDTLLFEPDQGRFSVVWRLVQDMANDPYRYHRIEVGERPKGIMVRIPLEVLTGELPSSQRGPAHRGLP